VVLGLRPQETTQRRTAQFWRNCFRTQRHPQRGCSQKTTKGGNKSAHITGEHITEDILNSFILEKMDDLLPPLLFWDHFFIPTFLCNNR
jgi:hypothetical protein